MEMDKDNKCKDLTYRIIICELVEGSTVCLGHHHQELLSTVRPFIKSLQHLHLTNLIVVSFLVVEERQH